MSDMGNPDLLRVARQWRGLLQGDAAQRLGVSQAMLSRVENRLSGFTGDLIERAAAVFGMPRTFFIQTDTVLGAPVSVHPMWRKKAAVSAREMDQIVAELNLRLMHMRRLLRAVEIEATYPIPALPVDEFESVERIAALARAQWQMPAGPVPNLTRLLEAAGIVVVHSDMAGSAVDGVTFSAPGLPPLIVLNVNQPADRMRFTLAHELGHLVMHRTQPTQQMEEQANEFASFFLMPTQDIKPYYARRIDLRLLAELKPVWRVSMASLLMRARSLGLLAYNQERYLWQQFSIAKIRQGEPPELDFAAEPATVLPDLMEAHIRQLGYSIPDLAGMLQLEPEELNALYGLSITPQPPAAAHLRIIK
ncbi:ImmA/IrrE family metallo-endopeptidase [Piscinibacter defluvii]|uniref:ImmA/IrrE family metallo-endopeptidase n=1 Tax=Piscinibacter defluvii TaxID=1796922 RepID=UPI000FDD6421|nr:XRE family transcriptional regulator [Piscinibacter defluvii]